MASVVVPIAQYEFQSASPMPVGSVRASPVQSQDYIGQGLSALGQGLFRAGAEVQQVRTERERKLEIYNEQEDALSIAEAKSNADKAIRERLLKAQESGEADTPGFTEKIVPELERIASQATPKTRSELGAARWKVENTELVNSAGLTAMGMEAKGRAARIDRVSTEGDDAELNELSKSTDYAKGIPAAVARREESWRSFGMTEENVKLRKSAFTKRAADAVLGNIITQAAAEDTPLALAKAWGVLEGDNEITRSLTPQQREQAENRLISMSSQQSREKRAEERQAKEEVSISLFNEATRMKGEGNLVVPWADANMAALGSRYPAVRAMAEASRSHDTENGLLKLQAVRAMTANKNESEGEFKDRRMNALINLFVSTGTEGITYDTYKEAVREFETVPPYVSGQLHFLEAYFPDTRSAAQKMADGMEGETPSPAVEKRMAVYNELLKSWRLGFIRDEAAASKKVADIIERGKKLQLDFPQVAIPFTDGKPPADLAQARRDSRAAWVKVRTGAVLSAEEKKNLDAWEEYFRSTAGKTPTKGNQ